MLKRFSANHSGKTLLAIILAGSFYLLLSWTGNLDRPEAGIRDRIIAVIMSAVLMRSGAGRGPATSTLVLLQRWATQASAR